MLLRVIGSPDPYAKQIDGMGELPRAPANLYSCKKAIERITTSTTFSVKYRSINLC